jgi:hypothetical protein
VILVGAPGESPGERLWLTKLLSRTRRGHLYFAWQFTDAGQGLPGLVDVLTALAEHDPWARARFFLSGNARLRGKRPLDLLRAGVGNLDRVLLAAGAFAQHGGS